MIYENGEVSNNNSSDNIGREDIYEDNGEKLVLALLLIYTWDLKQSQ